MKKPIMKFLSLACTAALLSVTAAAAPIDSVRQDNIKRQVLISGSAGASNAGKSVTVAFLPADKAGLTEPGFSDFSYLKQLVLDSRGCYTAAFALDQPTGAYVARAFLPGEAEPVEQSFQFYSFAEVDAALALINAADAAGLKTLLEEKKTELGIDSELYQAMIRSGKSLTAMYQAIAGHGAFSSIPDFILYFEQQLRVAAAGSGDAEIAGLLVKENPELWEGLLAYAAYQGMDGTVQAAVHAKLSGLSASNDQELRRSFVQSVLLAQVQTSRWQEVMTLLQGTLDAEAGLNLTNFNRYPSEAAKRVAGESYATVVQLQAALDSVTGADSGGTGHTGGNTGGGGSRPAGGSGGFTVETQPAETPQEPEDKSFHDLAGYEWARPSIEALASRGILNGVAPNQFDPGAQVTREEFVAMLVRAFPMDYSGRPADFADVPGGAWYEQAVAAAQENGIINGVGSGFFGVGKAITREELAKMAYYTLEEICGVSAAGDSGSFQDHQEIAEYARIPVGAMHVLGIINGYEDGGFHPRDNASRAEAAKIIYGMLQQAGGISE